MKKNNLIILLLFSITVFGQGTSNNKPTSKKSSVTSAVPSLDDLSGKWMDASTLLNFPAVSNFIGTVQSTKNLVAFSNLTFPPYSQGDLSGELFLDGKPLDATESLWHPCEIRRKTTIKGVELESIMRMAFEQQGVLIRLKIKNESKETQTLKLSMDCIGRSRLYEPQKWRT